MQQNFINILFTIILSFVLVPIFAQNGNNPFELTPRLEEQAQQNTSTKELEDTNIKSSNNAEISTQNPFEVGEKANKVSPTITTDQAKATNPFDLGEEATKPIESQPSEPEKEEAKEVVVQQSDNPFDLVSDSTEGTVVSEKKPANRPEVENTTSLPKIDKTISPLAGNNKSYQQFLFRVVLFMLILLTLLVTLFRSFLAKTYQAFLNDNILSIIYRERGSILISPYTILYMMFLINAGIFVFLLTEYYQIPWATSRFSSLMLSIGLVFAIFVLKHLILEVLAFIFPIKKEVRLYNFTIIIFGIMIGIILVPVNTLMAYAPSGITSSVVYAALGIVGLIYLFRSLRGLFIANRFLLFHKFHFLLYICTVEIAPIIIFLKLLSS